ncbi:MAG: ABC transporter ATP-binding protein/permease [Vampirovibrio sp.]|nr:ABC transporter ATP-binding protein/permease [Vampirovibrio sp.]
MQWKLWIQDRFSHPIFKNAGLLGLYKREFAWGFIALAATNAMTVIIPLLVQAAIYLMDPTAPENKDPGLFLKVLDQLDLGAYKTLDTVFWTIFATALINLVVRVASRQFLLGVGRKIEYEVRNRMYNHLLKLPVQFFSKYPPGELMSRMTNDVQIIRTLSGGAFMLLFNTVSIYLFSIPMMLMLSWKLTLVTFMLYPLSVWLMSKISDRVKTAYYAVQAVLGDISNQAQENLNGMMVIQSYAKEPLEAKRFEDLSNRYLDRMGDLIRQRVWLFLMMAVLTGVSMLLILGEGGREVIWGELGLGGFVAFTLYLERLSWPTMALGWAVSTFQQSAAAFERLDEILSAGPTEAEMTSTGPTQANTDPSQGLSLKQVTFAYPVEPGTEANLPALKDITLAISPGTTVGLVGPVGCGKTTLLKLIPKLYSLETGHIFLDGQDIRHIAIEDLRRRVVLMPQQSFLFSATVGQNIAYGEPNTSMEKLADTATVAGVHQDIEGFANGYNTIVGERGLTLSGGQRQRSALARTLLVESEVLLLDDPFSNVDSGVEQRIIEGLAARKTFADKITLMATHRFSILPSLDWLVLMDEGKIIATGTHTELLASQPLYQQLYEKQQTQSEEQETAS